MLLIFQYSNISKKPLKNGFYSFLFMQVSIYARAQDLGHLLELKQAGITDCILENAEVNVLETSTVDACKL
jgi:hypothetical protein